MRINKKAIINEIIVEPAKEKGFEYSWDGTKFWDKQYLANFSRTGYGQEFQIIEDFTDPGTLVLMVNLENEHSFKYNQVDADSFRTAIKSIQEYLDNEGYAELEGFRKRHTIQNSDTDYVEKHINELVEQFCAERDISDVRSCDSVKYIAKALCEIQGREWEEIKEEFYRIVAFYMHELLTIPALEMYKQVYNAGTDEEFRIHQIRRKDDLDVFAYPIKTALGGLYCDCGYDEMEGEIYFELNRLLSIGELEEQNIPVLPWKRFNAEQV